MSGAETARRRVVQRRIGVAETAAPKWPSPYFLSLNTEKYDWVCNPLVDVPSNIGFKLCVEEELATISSDRSLKIEHS